MFQMLLQPVTKALNAWEKAIGIKKKADLVSGLNPTDLTWFIDEMTHSI